MRSLLLVPFLAACGGSAKATEVPGNEAAAAPAPCPSRAELDAIAAKAWAPASDVEDLWCQALRVDGEPHWWLAGYARVGPDEPGLPYYGLVATDGNAVWTLAEPFDEFYPEGTDAEAHDLDGDGTDEVIYRETAGEGGGSSFAVVVVGVGGGQPRFGRAELGWQNEDEGCAGEWEVTDGVVVITTEPACASYAGRFRWDGSTLVTE